MAIEPVQMSIPLDDGVSVRALLYAANKKNRLAATVILAHGAGAPQTHPFMKLFATGLAGRGVDVVTFNFQYMNQARRAPDPKAKLEACYASVIAAVVTNKKLKGNRLVIGGKSMGGRIASQVAAALPRSDKSVTGLVFLGYPLHPPGKPEQLRDAHLPQIESPMVFIQGSRDSFGSGQEIRAIVKKHKLPATLHIVEGGDHSLKVPKSSGLTQAEVYNSALEAIVDWVQK
ncbi:MAG TPA: alpha/beta fold hydrolase [Pyrinomonadaceae bacterium]|nr:alpha/beta fold hydrolase [Pyrinomonadaceae bacterium]